MMEDNYAKAYKEIVEILKYVPEDSVNRIPKEMRDMFEAEQLKTYNFQIDTGKAFEEQILLEETEAILANIFRDYWANDYQRAKIIEKENKDRKEWEEEKRRKYNPDDIFKNRQTEERKEEQIINLPIEIKKENFFKRLVRFIRERILKNG